MKLYQLEGVAQIDGEVRHPGYRFSLPDDVLPPMRTVRGVNGAQIDVPLAVELDQGHQKEIDDLAVKHAAELAAADPATKRDEILARQAKERAQLSAKVGEAALKAKHDAEEKALTDQQEAERAALEAKPAVTIAPPPEASTEDLAKRHEREKAALTERQEIERQDVVAAKEAQPAQEAPPSKPKPAVAPVAR